MSPSWRYFTRISSMFFLLNIRLLPGYPDNKPGSSTFFEIRPSITPLCSSTIFLVIINPRPVPFGAFGRKKTLEDILFYFRVHPAASILYLVFNPPTTRFFWVRTVYHFVLGRAGSQQGYRHQWHWSPDSAGSDK